MNYYEHHIGDFAKDAGYLSMLEEGAYRRLLDAYYTREKALPADLRECCKIAKATSKPERDAVAYALREFFTLQEDGWHQKRCDEEISRFKVKQEKARRSANARWNPDGSQSEGNANASADAMRTHSEGNAPRARPQTPDTSHQAKASAPHTPQTDAGRACLLMRQAGCVRVNPSNPNLLDGLEEGVTPETFGQYAALAVANGKTDPFAYAIAAARGDNRQPKPGATHAAGTPGRKLSAVERVEANIERARRARGEFPAVDGILEGQATRVPR